LSEFQCIHFSSHELFAAIHVPEKFGSHPAFIGEFGLPSKNVKSSNRLWWRRLHRERVAQSSGDGVAQVWRKIHALGQFTRRPLLDERSILAPVLGLLARAFPGEATWRKRFGHRQR
jgi:hypothetical protein